MSKQSMKIGIIGAYGGQGQRILSYKYENIELEYLIYEHDRKKKRKKLQKINYSIKNDLKELFLCDGIIIAAPTSEHFYYLDFFMGQDYKGLIFCEKPPVETNEELIRLRNIKNKNKILFGFNLRFSIYQDILAGKVDYNLGMLRHCSIFSGHGLGYKDIYASSWRNDATKTKKGIFETVSIHYLDVFINQFGKPKDTFFAPSILSEHGQVWDNCMYNAVFKNEVTLNIFNSYLTPFIEEAVMVFEDGVVKINKNLYQIFYPRDSFDLRGCYMTPPVVYEHNYQNGIWEESQKRIIELFYSYILEEKEFSENGFNRSVETMEYILDISK